VLRSLPFRVAYKFLKCVRRGSRKLILTADRVQSALSPEEQAVPDDGG
jgi:hypothetical protein